MANDALKRLPAPKYKYITETSKLQEALEPYQKCRYVALDIETTYNGGFGSPLPCLGAIRLVQLGIRTPQGDQQLIVDLFHVDDPSALVEFLSSRDKEWIIHNSRYEASWLYYHFGVELGRIYDTCAVWRQIQKVRRTTRPRHNKHTNELGEVVRRVMGWKMDKECQASDWSRGLSEEQLHYAALDVAVLIPLASRTRAYARRDKIERDELYQLCQGVAKAAVDQLRSPKLRLEDEHQRLKVLLNNARSKRELELCWRLGKRLSLHHANRRSLWQYLQTCQESLP